MNKRRSICQAVSFTLIGICILLPVSAAPAAERTHSVFSVRPDHAGKAVDAALVIATSGKKVPPNADLSMHHGSPNLPGKCYIESEGTGADYWGSCSKRPGFYDYINIGVYTDTMKREMLRRTDTHLDRGQGYLFASTWLQCPPPGGPHHTPGGMGTQDDPSVKCWLEHLKVRVGPYRLVRQR